MAKRFTDSDKWTKKPWFRSLPPSQKLFWIYLLDACDQCGVWEIDFSLAEILIGEKLNVEEIKAAFKKQYQEIANGRKWFIRDFIDFQYGDLKETNRMHSFVLRLLEKQGVSIPLEGVLDSAIDKEKDKEKDKGIVKGKFVKPSFEEVTAEFSAKGHPAEAQKFWNHFETVGWVVGKACKPMKSWRGAVATWLDNAKEWALEKPAARPAAQSRDYSRDNQEFSRKMQEWKQEAAQ